MFMPSPGRMRKASARPTTRATVVIASKYSSALPPTRPTFLRSPAPAMPCTTTQNTMGATIMEISLRKASLKNFSPTAKPGAAMPSTTPPIRAATTWMNNDL